MGINMLRKFLSVLLVVLMVGGLLIQNAEARRFGGGRSFGLSRVVFQHPAWGRIFIDHSKAQLPL
jgi:hypothetical protein